MLSTCFVELCEYVDGVCVKCHLTEMQKRRLPYMSADERRVLYFLIRHETERKGTKRDSTRQVSIFSYDKY